MDVAWQWHGPGFPASETPLKLRKRRLHTDPFWRSVGVVLAGTAGAQSIPILGSLVLARLYAPAEFGAFSTWVGLVALSAVMITGRFEMALALESDGEPRRVAAAATLFTALIGCIPLTLVGLALRTLVLEKTLGNALSAILVPAALLTAWAQTWQCWTAAEGRFRLLSVIRIAQAASITGLQIAAGFIWHSALALALAQIAGLLAGLLVASRCMPLDPRSLFRDNNFIRDVREFWKRQRRFVYFSLPSDSINSSAAQIPLILVTSRFGSEAGGFLALTQRTLGAPIALLGASVLDVFRRRAATSFRLHGNCRDDYVRTFKVLAAGALAVACVILLGGPALFAPVFGSRWEFSGTLAQWMTPMYALRFVASPLSYLFYVAGRQHLDLIWQSCLLALTVLTLGLGNSFRGSIIDYVTAYSLLYVIYLFISYRLSLGQAHDRDHRL